MNYQDPAPQTWQQQPVYQQNPYQQAQQPVYQQQNPYQQAEPVNQAPQQQVPQHGGSLCSPSTAGEPGSS